MADDKDELRCLRNGRKTEAMYSRYMHAYGEEGIKVLDIHSSSAHDDRELKIQSAVGSRVHD